MIIAGLLIAFFTVKNGKTKVNNNDNAYVNASVFNSTDDKEQPDNDTDNAGKNNVDGGSSESSQTDNSYGNNAASTSAGGGSHSDYNDSYADSAVGRLHVSGTHISDTGRWFKEAFRS